MEVVEEDDQNCDSAVSSEAPAFAQKTSGSSHTTFLFSLPPNGPLEASLRPPMIPMNLPMTNHAFSTVRQGPRMWGPSPQPPPRLLASSHSQPPRGIKQSLASHSNTSSASPSPLVPKKPPAKKKDQIWTREENELLKQGLEQFGNARNRFEKIRMNFLPHRSTRSIRGHLRVLTNENSQSQYPIAQSWTEEEDALLQQGINEFGLHAQSLISKSFLPHRSTQSVRSRMIRLLKSGELVAPKDSRALTHPASEPNQFQKRSAATTTAVPTAKPPTANCETPNEETNALEVLLSLLSGEVGDTDGLLTDDDHREELNECETSGDQQEATGSADHPPFFDSSKLWTTEDDRKLAEGIRKYGWGAWDKIRDESFPECTALAIQNHVLRVKRKMALARKIWTREENELLKQGLQQFGNARNRYEKIRTHFLPHRSTRSIRGHLPRVLTNENSQTSTQPKDLNVLRAPAQSPYSAIQKRAAATTTTVPTVKPPTANCDQPPLTPNEETNALEVLLSLLSGDELLADDHRQELEERETSSEQQEVTSSDEHKLWTTEDD